MIKLGKLSIGYNKHNQWDYFYDCPSEVIIHFIGIEWNDNLSFGLEWRSIQSAN